MDDLVQDKSAFAMLLWFGTLLMLAEELRFQGFFTWLAAHLKVRHPLGASREDGPS